MSNPNPYADVQVENLDFYEEVLVTLTKAHENLQKFPNTYIGANDTRAVDACGEPVDLWDHRAVQWSAIGLLQVHDWRYVEFWENHEYRPHVEPPDLFASDAAINFLNYELRASNGLQGIADHKKGREILRDTLHHARNKLKERIKAVRAVKREVAAVVAR